MHDKYAKFDLDDPELPNWIEREALQSDDYPYDEKLSNKIYEKELLALQIELVKLQSHLQTSGERVVIIFEGRDAAGKGGTIKRYLENLNARVNHIAALSKPNESERGQWYFQRYIDWLPSAGETVLFDRSWYNRAGVEPVMGFCTPEQTARFLIEAPRFEHMLTEDGIHMFKFWLNIGRAMQLKRFHDRRHDPLKVWKLSPIDLEALQKWDGYTKARNVMLETTDTAHAPWTTVQANDKRRARLGVIRSVLSRMNYADKSDDAIGKQDDKIVMGASEFLKLKAD